ncbi:nuclear transport factor 2 [Hymenopellis radicata]|nr:nuclear transport factor 2 [Mucidula mucida]KAF9049199.1 nuclear transport factor 2 [Hymenopellis radicata]
MSAFNPAIAVEFVNFYYGTFDANRANLLSLYRDGSMMTWEDTQLMGAGPIVEKLTSLPFQTVKHTVVKCDPQPSLTPGSMIVLVTGNLQIDDGEQKLPFTQTFQLVQEGETYYVFNDIFRLNIG